MFRHRFALLLLLAVSHAALGQGSITIAPSDPAYRDVDRLIDARLVDAVIVGQRPYSRREMVRIARSAELALASREGTALDRVAITRLLTRFADADTSVGEALSAAGVHLLYTDAPSRAIPSNGLGDTEADVNPLTDHRAGRRFASHANAGLETEHWARLGSQLTVAARPRLWASRQSGERVALLSGMARVTLANLAITAGREYSYWGNAPGGGVFFSDNAPALDMIRLASDAPFRLPSILGRAGVLGATLQYADMGASASRSHSRYLAYKVSLQPGRDVELGATFANHFGGEGATNPTFGRRLIDFMPLIDLFIRHPDSAAFDSDKLIGFDARMRLPFAANTTLFAELGLEDWDFHRLGSVFTEDAAWMLGAIIPSLGMPGLSARLSLHQTGLRFYAHHAVRNGITSSRFVLGDGLARDGTGYYSELNWERADGFALVATGALEERRNDAYTGLYTQPGDQGFVFRLDSIRPRERRARAGLSVRHRALDGRMHVQLGGALERTENFGFVPRSAATHGVFETSFTIYR